MPEGQRKENVPCRFIPLTKDGQTVDDLYPTGNQMEMEEALVGWLRKQIAKLESERAQAAKQGAA